MKDNNSNNQSRLKYFLIKHVFKITIIALLAIGLSMGLLVKTTFYADNKTTKIGFENIGELATQVALTTSVGVEKDSQNFFGLFEIPFTQSQYVYTYDAVFKAGIDFNKIEWDFSEAKKLISVKLPEVKILSKELKLDSFKVFQDSQSIFTPITLEKHNKAISKMLNQAKKDAIKNGLLKNAKTNAETIIRQFFAKNYDLDKYKLEFID